MDRRTFFKASAGVALTAGLPFDSLAAVTRDKAAPSALKIKEITINCGASKKFSALQISDSHLALVDKRDDERKIKLAANRNFHFGSAAYYLFEAFRYAQDNNLLLLHTGDMIDFVSEANLDMAAMMFQTTDCFAACGNHEFSKYVGDAKEDEAYKADSFAKVQAAFPTDFGVSSKVVNGVNLVTLDNVYYYVTPEQVVKMKAEFAKGLPVVILCHVPFYTPKHHAFEIEHTKGLAGYMCGAPIELTSQYEHDDNRPANEQWRNRSVQQKADETTLEFISWLKQQKQLKAILCGHMHIAFEERFSPTAIQYTCGAGYKGEAQLIRFV